MTGLPGVKPAFVSPEWFIPGYHRLAAIGRHAALTPEHIFVGDDYQTLYTADEVLTAVENRSFCTIGPLPVILFRKGVITAEEFLESIHARDFTVAR
ncbi:hypothetical protein EVC03_014 [Rhizobium phage RHph_Y5A]|nr:hypothetical protein EVC03_014 [Rhizobium phage RHph_Y5A]QIG75456.1 hypothetical protein EVC18_014 [Rhizobium phage RHph_Y2_4]